MPDRDAPSEPNSASEPPDPHRVAHDLNNELNVIGGYLELLAAQPLAQGAALEYLQEMRLAFHRARVLVRSLRGAA